MNEERGWLYKWLRDNYYISPIPDEPWEEQRNTAMCVFLIIMGILLVIAPYFFK